jgi:hypothetical protein
LASLAIQRFEPPHRFAASGGIRAMQRGSTVKRTFGID